MRPNLKVVLLKALAHLVLIIPITWAFFSALVGLEPGDPVQYLLRFTGIGTLNILFITLLIPALARFKWPKLMRLRRLVGLYVFFYASVHLAVVILFELGVDWRLFISEVLERKYIWPGLAAWIGLLVLALTSPLFVRKKMGACWQTLHSGIYLIALLGIWHFFWSQKAAAFEPLCYVLVCLFFIARRCFRSSFIKNFQ